MFYFSPSVKINKGKDKKGNERKGKHWRATIYYIDSATQKKKQKTKMLLEAKGKKEAQKMAEAWMDELNKSIQDTVTAGKDKTIREIIEEYELYKLTVIGIQKSTYQRDLIVTKNYINPYLGEYLFTSLDKNDLDKWIGDLFNKGLSPTTVRNAYTQLQKVYNYLFSNDLIEKNPFDNRKPPKGGKNKVTHLTKEQGKEFVNKVFSEFDIYEPMCSGCMLAYYAGLRRGEICGLRWRNIDFDSGTISIDSSIGIGKGGNYTKDPKNISSNREFPMVAQLYEVLKARYDYIKPESNWFVIGDKDKFMSLQTFTNNFQKFVDTYNLKDYYGKRITPHGLRHNLATVGIDSGMDIASLSLMLGHASRAVTLDIYGDANKDALKTATEKLSLQFDADSNREYSEETAEKLNKIERKHKQEPPTSPEGTE